MTSARATKLTFAVLSTAILMAVVAVLLFATPNGAFAAGPERPTDLTATAVDHDTVSLTWSHPDPTTVDHYQVLSRKQGSGAGKLTQVATSTTTSFQHDGLEPEATYIYRVKPVNSAGEQGQRSARAEATTPAEETPAPPVAPTPAPDPTPAPPQRSDDKGQDNIARASHQVLVTSDWSLIPAGLTTGDQFRLIFLSSTKRDGSSTDIANYNTFVQTRAAAGDTDIQAYSDGFKAVGCTEDVDATDNTSTTGTGVPIYWLNGNKAADDYDDFYDGTWDDEANDKNELGENGPDTSQTTNYPLTGCLDDGTEAVSGSNSRGLGGSLVRLGRPNSSASGNGPLSSSSNVGNTADRPMYGLSGVFQVAEANTTLVSNTGQASADFATNAVDYGQAFTTGSETAGYTLDAIDIGYNDSSNTAFSASIWSTYALDKAPNAVLYSLTPPATFSPGNLTFTAPPNTTLTSGTTYIIMFALESAGGATVKRTATVNPDEDAGAAAGWSIANNYIFAISGGWGQNGAFGPLLVAVKGTVYAGSNDATLSALTVNDGTNDITLTPTFAPGTTTYTAPVVNSIDEITITPTVNDTTTPATYEIQNSAGTALTDADTNTTGFQVALSVGANIIKVEVTAEDASTETYTVTVTRAAAATPTVSISADKTTAVYREDTITYTLTRIGSTAAALPVSVTFTQTKDFLLATALSKTVTIPAGQTTETFTVAAFSFQHFATGTAVEAGTLTAAVQDGTDYDLGTSPSVDVNIVIGPMIRIEHASYSVNEADGALIVQVIARTGPGAPQPTVNTNTVLILFEDVTTIEGTDYSTIQGDTFLFETGGFSMDGTEWKSAKTYHISITPDDIDEDDETFLLAIDYLNNNFLKNILVDSSGNACDPVDGCKVTVTIVDDDTAGVTVSKSAVTVTEENTTGDTYTVVLDSQPTANVTITIGGQGAADITATPTPLTFTTTNWATAQTVTVTAGDDTDTAIDTHSLTHSAASSDTDYSGIPIANVGVTVNDNDSTLPALSFDNINITVDEDGSQAALSVELSQASADTVTVDYATSDITAEAGDDYTETSGTLTFAADETVKAIIVPVLDDAIYEPTERFNVTLSNPTGATLPTFPGAQINIAVDESPPTASMANVTVDEGAGTMTLTLNLSHESSRNTSYETTTSRVGGTATQGADYENFLSGGEARITVPAGDTQATLDIAITDDTAQESSETITIRWDNDPTGISNGDATPATINFTGTITDNDSADDSASGKPGITGAAQVGMTLTAGTANIMDTDGLTTPGYTYQWLRAGSNISGATSSTYTLTSSDYGETIQVKVDFTDDASNEHSLTSDETVPVAPVAATCPTNTDTVWCATLTVGHSLDSDGDPSGSGFESRSGRTAFGSLSGTTFTHLGVNYTVKTVWGGGRNDLVFSTTPNLPLDGAGLTLHVQVYDGELDAPLADASFNSSDHWFFGTALYVDSAGQLSNVPLIRGQYSSGARVQAPPDVGTKVMVRLSINLTVPTAPRHLNASAVGDNHINLTWDAPSSNGGSTITGYKIEVSNNGRIQLDHPGCQHRQLQPHPLPYGTLRRRHAPLPRLRHQRQRNWPTLQRRQGHHRTADGQHQ